MNKQLTFDFYKRTFNAEQYISLMLPVRVREDRIPIIPEYKITLSWGRKLINAILGD